MISFSDSAFVAFKDFQAAAQFAGTLLRSLIYAQVPVRLGIAAGSFKALRFMSDSHGGSHIHLAEFVGTAVTRAVAAEGSLQSVAAVLHPSLKQWVSSSGDLSNVLPFDDERPERWAELNYLGACLGGLERLASDDKILWLRKLWGQMLKALEEMAGVAPPAKRHYYLNGICALNRMGEALEAKWAVEAQAGTSPS